MSAERMPVPGDVWEHYNGCQYVVLFIANASTTRPEQYPVTVVYMGYENGLVWSRPLSKWHRSMTYIGECPDEGPNQT